jgi:hypothetical protein
MAKTKENLPKILTANNLLSGTTIYYTASGTWSGHVADALVAATPEAVETLTKAGTDAFAANLVIDEAVVDVNPGGEIRPARLREVIRATGPTVRLDLSKYISQDK